METRKHTNNLQKSSVLFLQLGLVLTLMTTYLAFELKTEQRTVDFDKPSVETDDPYEFKPYEEFQIEERIVKKTKRIAIKQSSSEFVIDDKVIPKDDTLPFVQEDPDKENSVDLGGLVDVDEPDIFIENVPYTSIQEVPIFPGCEKVKESKRRACFDKKMQSHIQRKFNSSIVSQQGLTSGNKKIWVEFVITKTGEIEITNTRAPNVRLEKEGKRVVNKLPTMIPGKQNGKNVGVKYRLPIVFKVD